MPSQIKDILKQALMAQQSKGQGGTPGEDDDAPARPLGGLPASVSLPPPEREEPLRPAAAQVVLSEETQGLGVGGGAAIAPPRINLPTSQRFRPVEPKTLEETGLDGEFVKTLIVKYLMDFPRSSGRQIGAALALNQACLRELFHELRERKYIVAPGTVGAGDFQYALTEAGRAYALDLRKMCRYVSPAPVPFEQWLLSVHEQSLSRESPSVEDLRRAFGDLLVPEGLFWELGPALTAGKGLFLFGPPGNGKTSLAQRVTRAFGTAVYLPHAILIEGHIVKIFDPMVHEELVEEDRQLQRLDERWIKCMRPTVVAGGELTMDNLELDFNEQTGISEAPIQVKANCGTLVIDDFGRQRVDPATLLNRWIVPLENRVDYLRLPDGRKVQVPFDPLLIFSTNLDPRDLCDEAFLRRIPYKVSVHDPSEEDFRALLRLQSESLGFEPAEDVFDYLIYTYYQQTGRPFRNCHPRDLLLQVQAQCEFWRAPLRISRETIDMAAQLYFTLL